MKDERLTLGDVALLLTFVAWAGLILFQALRPARPSASDSVIFPPVISAQ